ncbi:MAG: histidine kinase [Psychroserpens sp.]|nr:histidine kinase [Psychroserpens sp.]
MIQDNSKPKIFLEDLLIAYKSLDTIDLSQWTKSEKVLQLKPNQTQVGFTYRTIDLDNPEGIAYRFKLNDGDWSPWSKRNSQDFSELNFGTYEFMVQSRNYRWNESDPLKFLFFIEKPLTRKLWFQGMVLGVILLLILLGSHRYVVRQKLKAKQEKDRLKLENHLLNLEQKALRLQMNPHFIFNVLNGIKAMAPVKPEKMNDTVNNFAALLRETLNNSREETINLEQEIKTLKHYIQVEQLMAEEAFEYEIIVETEVDPEEILVPPMLIQPFVENAIRHGILKSSRKGKLELQFQTEKDLLKVRIVDNGVGINQSKQQQKADHKSMALKVTKERLASISEHHDLTIEELINKDGEVNGTSVSFNIPLITDF